MGNRDPRLNLAPYSGKEWANELVREMDESSAMEFKEYVGWGRKPYHGIYVNVDDNGVRKTWEPPDLPSTSTTIYFFGGSTMWGSGVQDDGTVASYASKILHEQNYPANVTNYGEGGYAFTQEIVKLSLLLRSGARPDYVIFYDGVNDVAASYESGEAGTAVNLPLIQDQLIPGSLAKIKSGLRQFAKENCVLCNTVLSAIRIISPNSFRAFNIAGSSYSDDQLKELADDTKTYYDTSLAMLDQLSRSYGFKYLTFWQPNLFFSNSSEELGKKLASVDPRAVDQKIAKLHVMVGAEMPDNPQMHFFNISDALKDQGENAFLDHA
ncbi:MAG: SGNH/GDSL hydrolase family protein, partial [Candidatus Liptonbacteria bacterium]